MRTELYTNLQTPKDHHRFVLESGLELFKCKDTVQRICISLETRMMYQQNFWRCHLIEPLTNEG